jgi:hypothetical protein
VPGIIRQGSFEYEVIEDSDTWTLVHDKRGTFAEVVFSKARVDMSAFRSPGKEQVTDLESSWLRTLSVMQRREDEVHLLRGRVYEVIGEQSIPPQIVESYREWLQLLTSHFRLYLGNVSHAQRNDLWDQVCVAHEEWVKAERTGAASD